MVNTWWFSALAGCVLGFLSGLGVGGGSLLMLWLTLVVGTDPAQARLMNLMFFLPCALCASLFRFRKARPDLALTGTAMAGGLAGAFLGAYLHTRLDLELARKALGVLFLVCGVRELRYRER
ncbi:MAG: sulfite exporter TauE/SafE family protein [Oscillospiraceae bacterium]|nr:sulfite exporter TauE/SafE family protein [Oscillospiraceae bacterium]